jgi:hypothetical protein
LLSLLTLSHDVPGLLKVSLSVFVADEQILDDPEDLTGKTTAQIGLYTHRGQDDRGLVIDQGPI